MIFCTQNIRLRGILGQQKYPVFRDFGLGHSSNVCNIPGYGTNTLAGVHLLIYFHLIDLKVSINVL